MIRAPPSPEYPAFSPNVVAVGGTTLDLTSTGTYGHETGWGSTSSPGGASFGSGGGISQFEPEPAYQQAVQTLGGRTIPDVALVADPATGAWIADPYNHAGSNPFVVVGGTSLAAPAWAGLLALVNQGRAAAGRKALDSTSPTEAQQALYSLPQNDYNVVSTGTNGYDANAGYNLVSGLGTPVANRLVGDLVAYQGLSTVYSGAKVASLQDATLHAATWGSGSGRDVLNVFDVLAPVGTGNASRSLSQIESQGTGAIAVQSMPATGASGTASSGVTILIFAPLARQTTYQVAAGTFQAAASPVAAVRTTSIAAAAMPESAANREGLASGLAPAQTSANEHAAPYWDARGARGTVDSVLDDLVTGLFDSSRRSSQHAATVSRVALTWRPDAHAALPAAHADDTSAKAVPAGPLSASDHSSRVSERPSGGQADPFLIAGFCGFGAALERAAKSASAKISSRQSRRNRPRRG